VIVPEQSRAYLAKLSGGILTMCNLLSGDQARGAYFSLFISFYFGYFSYYDVRNSITVSFWGFFFSFTCFIASLIQQQVLPLCVFIK
jgi:hypothetical protein